MNTEYNEEDYLNISGIQHFQFCKRQWALIHIEQQWQENLRTVEGQLMHQNAHNGTFSEKRGDTILSRGLPIFSKELGANGFCDVVEFHKDPNGVELYGRVEKYKVFPVEYKRGEPKENDADILQLTAQALCLQEMFCCEIKEGSLYYGEIRRRVQVNFTEELIEKVKSVFREMHQYYDNRYTPKVKPTKSCNACSLRNLCIPKLCRNLSVKDYINSHIKED